MLVYLGVYVNRKILHGVATSCMFIKFYDFFTYLSTSGSWPVLTPSLFGSIFSFSSFFTPFVPLVDMVFVDTVENSVSAESKIKTVTSPDKAVWDGGATTFNSIGSFASAIDLVIPETSKHESLRVAKSQILLLIDTFINNYLLINLIKKYRLSIHDLN